jgi:hypothetical protein
MSTTHELDDPIILRDTFNIVDAATRMRAIKDALNDSSKRAQAMPVGNEDIIIDGNQYSWEPTMLDFDNLLFDVANFRTPIACQEFGIDDPYSKWDSDQIEDQLIAMKALYECEYKEEGQRVLFDNLKSHKKLIRPLVVDGMGVVREGNKRLFAILELHKRGVWHRKQIEVVVLHEKIHVVGGGTELQPVTDKTLIQKVKEHYSKHDDGKRDHHDFEKAEQTYLRYNKVNPFDSTPLPAELANKSKENRKIIKEEFLLGEAISKFRDKTASLRDAGGKLILPVRTSGHMQIVQLMKDIVDVIKAIKRQYANNPLLNQFIDYAYQETISYIIMFHDVNHPDHDRTRQDCYRATHGEVCHKYFLHCFDNVWVESIPNFLMLKSQAVAPSQPATPTQNIQAPPQNIQAPPQNIQPVSSPPSGPSGAQGRLQRGGGTTPPPVATMSDYDSMKFDRDYVKQVKADKDRNGDDICEKIHDSVGKVTENIESLLITKISGKTQLVLSPENTGKIVKLLMNNICDSAGVIFEIEKLAPPMVQNKFVVDIFSKVVEHGLRLIYRVMQSNGQATNDVEKIIERQTLDAVRNHLFGKK